ncbi:MAG: metal-dependent hydrolase [Planctomycetota bacterium]
MENAAHTLAGLLLARLGFDRAGPAATATVVVASNLPDVDIVGTAWGGQPWYLCHHRGLTHAVVGLFVQGLLLGGAAWLIAGRRSRAPRLAPMLAAAWAGLFLHLGMDGLNNYGIRPWLPFDPRWVYGDLVFIVDPWLWLTLGAGACLGSPARGRPWGWAVFVLAGTALLAVAGRSPPGATVLWGLGMAAVLVTRWRRRSIDTRRRWAVAAAVAAVVYLLGLVALQRQARALGDAALPAQLRAEEGLEVRSLVARPCVPWRYGMLAQTEHRFYRLDLDVLRGTAVLEGWQERHLDDPGIERARDTPEYHAWRVFARHPFAGRWQGDLILGDGRYARDARPSWSNLRVP